MSDESNKKMTLTWRDGRGKTRTQEIEYMIDARKFLGMAGYPWLILAANARLSVATIALFLNSVSKTTPGTNRGLSWVQRHRWMFLPPKTSMRQDRDGNATRAKKIMNAHSTYSTRELVHLLKKHGIVRSREWVRMNRVTG